MLRSCVGAVGGGGPGAELEVGGGPRGDNRLGRAHEAHRESEMARIYVSSTFADLKLFREAVYRALRQLGHDVIAMEDYCASDSRPLGKCLADVASCAVYVGIIGDRYGFIPAEDNPDRKSITELEYRAATADKRERLIFLYKGAPDREFADAFTREGDGGRRVEEFKDELRGAHMVSEFATPDELAQKVTVAVANVFREAAAPEPAPAAAPDDHELESLRDSARTILKLYSAKSIHDILHDIFLKARVLRADDAAALDRRLLSDVASYCAPRMTSISAEVAQCDTCLEDAERRWVEAHRGPLEAAITALRDVAGEADREKRAASVGDFNERLATWLSDLDGVLQDLSGRLDGEQIRLVIAKLKDRYAAQLETVERNLQSLTGEANPVLGKCKALLEEHHGLQDVHDKLPSLFDRLASSDAQVAASEWRRLKRRLNSAQEAWKRFGGLPTGGEDWEEDVRDDGQLTWPVIESCIKEVDGVLVQESPATDGGAQAVRSLTKLQTRAEEHFKVVDEALREGYRLFKVRVGEPIMRL